MKNNKGFTLAELLVVVAIIAVLVAISIPIFTSQLEKSREANDEANLRVAYAEVTASALTETVANDHVQGDTTNGWTVEVPASQTEDGWVSGTSVNIGGVSVEAVTKGNSWVVKATSDGTVTFTKKQ